MAIHCTAQSCLLSFYPRVCCVVIVSHQPSGWLPHRGAEEFHVHFLPQPLLRALQAFTTIKGPTQSSHHQPHACLLFSPSLWRHHHPRYPEQDRLPGCVGPCAHVYPQNSPDVPPPSLFKQPCRANEGRGRHNKEGKPPSSH